MEYYYFCSSISILGQIITNPCYSTENLVACDCLFNEHSLYIQYNDSLKDYITIPYQSIKDIQLFVCSRFGVKLRAFFEREYHMDIVIHVSNDEYHLEIEPTCNIYKLADFMMKKNITFQDPFHILSISQKDDFYVLFKEYMSAHFDEIAKKYHLDNPRIRM